MNKKLKNTGITLISLVITIIIMLILVGVSITLAVNGGLFEYAGNAVGDTKNAMEQEQSLIDDIIENYINTNVPIEGNDGEMFSPIYTENTTITQGEYTATIPAGFAVGTSEGINKIETGLVIRDKDGNEFVWVPCTTAESELNKSGKEYAKDTTYNELYYKQNKYKDYSDWDDEGIELKKISVTEYGGFYVARYEAGLPSEANLSGTTSGAEYKYIYTDENGEEKSIRNTDKYVPVSKRNNPSWNGISQKNAKTVSANMYKDSGSVESSLIDSYAWDTIVNWMESKITGIAINSKNYGNYLNSTMTLTDVLCAKHVLNFSGTSSTLITRASTYEKCDLEITSRTESGDVEIYELATGSTEKTKVLNIYDMAGNMWEWTLETGYHDEEEKTIQYAVRRGGGCDYGDGKRPLVYRTGNFSVDSIGNRVGFRVVLNVK